MDAALHAHQHTTTCGDRANRMHEVGIQLVSHSLASETVKCGSVEVWKHKVSESLPSNQEAPDSLKLSFGQRFGEDVGFLNFGTDVFGNNAFGFSNVRAEEVIL